MLEAQMTPDSYSSVLNQIKGKNDKIVFDQITNLGERQQFCMNVGYPILFYTAEKRLLKTDSGLVLTPNQKIIKPGQLVGKNMTWFYGGRYRIKIIFFPNKLSLSVHSP